MQLATYMTGSLDNRKSDGVGGEAVCGTSSAIEALNHPPLTTIVRPARRAWPNRARRRHQ
eukprot:scaffold189136_cov31-Tisochrysis_lutea.AAC.2